MVQPPEQRPTTPPLTRPPEEPQELKAIVVHHKGFSIKKMLHALKKIRKKSFWQAVFTLGIYKRKTAALESAPRLNTTETPEPDLHPELVARCRANRREQLHNLVEAICEGHTTNAVKALYHYRKEIVSEHFILKKELIAQHFADISRSELLQLDLPTDTISKLRGRSYFIQQLNASLLSLSDLDTKAGEDALSTLSHTATGCATSSYFALGSLLEICHGEEDINIRAVPTNQKLAMQCFSCLRELNTDMEAASQQYVRSIERGNLPGVRRYSEEWFNATRAHCQSHGLPDDSESVIQQMAAASRYMTIPQSAEVRFMQNTRSPDETLPRLFASLHQVYDESPLGSREGLMAYAALAVNDVLCKRMERAENTVELVTHLQALPDPEMVRELKSSFRQPLSRPIDLSRYEQNRDFNQS